MRHCSICVPWIELLWLGLLSCFCFLFCSWSRIVSLSVILRELVGGRQGLFFSPLRHFFLEQQRFFLVFLVQCFVSFPICDPRICRFKFQENVTINFDICLEKVHKEENIFSTYSQPKSKDFMSYFRPSAVPQCGLLLQKYNKITHILLFFMIELMICCYNVEFSVPRLCNPYIFVTSLWHFLAFSEIAIMGWITIAFNLFAALSRPAAPPARLYICIFLRVP